MNCVLGADHVAWALTTDDGDSGFRVERGGALYERGRRACDLVAFVELYHRIDGVGARSLKLESGSYHRVVVVDYGIEVLAAGYGDYPIGTHQEHGRRDHDHSKAYQFEEVLQSSTFPRMATQRRLPHAL